MLTHAVSVLLAVLLATAAVAQTPTPATFNPLPADNASFFTALRTFLLGEDADRYAASLQAMHITACSHGTSAGMTGTFGSTCTAFVDGSYIVDPAASIDYATQGAAANDFCWVILHKDTTSAVTGFTRVAGTHYLTDCASASGTRPTLPDATVAIYVMGVTISGSAITAVEPLYADFSWIKTYTNVSEINDVRAGIFWVSDAGLLCYGNSATCATIATGDAGGCATCGDSAASFFSAGAIEPARGGTGDDTSATTGVPFISAGNWSYDAQLHPSRGGTGYNSSGDTGVPSIAAGTWSTNNFPLINDALVPPALAVDGTQCVQNDNATLATGVLANVIECADNAAGQIFGQFRLPTGYQSNSAITFRLVAQNTAAASGVTAFDLSCMCDSSAGISNAANFSAASNLDFSWSGSDDEVLIQSVSLTCGNACNAGDSLIVRLVVDDTTTTYVTPANVKYTLLAMQATANDM